MATDVVANILPDAAGLDGVAAGVDNARGIPKQLASSGSCNRPPCPIVVTCCNAVVAPAYHAHIGAKYQAGAWIEADCRVTDSVKGGEEEDHHCRTAADDSHRNG